MKIILFLTMLLLQVSLGQLPKIAIIDFTSTSLKESEINSISSGFAKAIYKSGHYDIIDRSNIKNIIEELNFQNLDLVDNGEKAAKTGKLLGVEKIIFGKVEKSGKVYTINIKMVNVSTARVENFVSEQYKGKLKNLIDKELLKIARENFYLQPIEVEFTFISTRNKKSITVSFGDTLMSGDRIHLTIKPNQRCYVYVVNQDAKGNIYSLFPNPTQVYEALKPNQEYHVPAEASSFELDDNAGKEVVYVVASKVPVKDLEKLIKPENAVDKQQLVKKLAKRGMASIVDGNNNRISLDKGVSFEGISKLLSGNKSFFYKLEFFHVSGK